jgi:hypothetical protein
MERWAARIRRWPAYVGQCVGNTWVDPAALIRRRRAPLLGVCCLRAYSARLIHWQRAALLLRTAQLQTSPADCECKIMAVRRLMSSLKSRAGGHAMLARKRSIHSRSRGGIRHDVGTSMKDLCHEAFCSPTSTACRKCPCLLASCACLAPVVPELEGLLCFARAVLVGARSLRSRLPQASKQGAQRGSRHVALCRVPLPNHSRA